MEFVIFGTANLIALMLLVALTVLPLYLLSLIGQRLGHFIGFQAMRWILPIFGTGLAAAWGLASFSAFEKACHSVPGVIVLSRPNVEPSGFVVRGRSNRSFGSLEFNWPTALETGAFQFVDAEGGRRCLGKKENERALLFPTTHDCDLSDQPGMIVDVLPHARSSLWWYPPIFEATIEIREFDSGRVLAKATDLVFGGGLTGKYLRLLGGDQDFEHLSCGFALSDIGPWRPSLVSHPRFSEYLHADLKLIKLAAGKQ
ncbi:hypothetical protein [Azonexus sp.]|uniref:hypothetical protein n=1 Tax=Azonexus sp. TaxID=1872668 RepID=UPI0027B8FCCB|nr:hypothetical protein [Azonexus sp.]